MYLTTGHSQIIATCSKQPQSSHTLSMVVNSAVNTACERSGIVWSNQAIALQLRDTEGYSRIFIATSGSEVVCLLCGLKHLHEQRAAPCAFNDDCLHNAFQPVLLSLFINGFASQEDPNPLNCFRIQSAASTQPYIKEFIISHCRLNISVHSC
jgi:hypothetical protein